MKIGIVVGSIREVRLGGNVGEWVRQNAATRTAATYEVIDLKSFNVPLLTSGVHPMAAKKQYDSPEAMAWSAAIDACDAFVFVTPEYNHSVPGAFKNAIDTLGSEWTGKAVGLVGYGSVGGVRSIEHWRAIMTTFGAATVRAEVNLSTFTDFADRQVIPSELKTGNLIALFDQLERLTAKLKGSVA